MSDWSHREIELIAGQRLAIDECEPAPLARHRQSRFARAAHRVAEGAVADLQVE